MNLIQIVFSAKENGLKYSKYILLLFLILSLTILGINQERKKNEPNNLRALESLNISFQKIEVYFAERQYNNACSEAIYADRLIRTNLNLLKELEPNYAWEEMSILLKTIPKQLCK
tara:strand:+ start:109 stop:456 length:348 start_codon:yes stop_codon:yes gene_type:complete